MIVTPGRIYLRNGDKVTVTPGYAINDTFYIRKKQNAKTFSLGKHFIEFLLKDMPHFAWTRQHLPLKVQGSLSAVGITHNEEYLFLVAVTVNNTSIYGHTR